MLKIFASPSRYIQGVDASSQLAAEIIRMELGPRVLIISSQSARKLLEPLWNTTFDSAGLNITVSDFHGECTAAEIQRLKESALQSGASCIIGAGGGKVLDTARCVASELNLPAINCPTTASSDAPCSALSVVYTPEGVFEECRFFKRNPDLVLVDTRIIIKAPVRLLIAGMGDALATWFEAETATLAQKKNTLGGFTTIAALSLAKLCYETLLTDGSSALDAARSGAINPAFERIVEANTLLSGLGFESAGLCVAHSVHNGLTVLPQTHRLLHGEKVAFGTLVQLVLEGRPESLINDVLEFCLSVGLPTCFSDLGLDGLSYEQAKLVASRSIAEGETAHNVAFPLTIELMIDALMATNKYATQYKSRRK